MNQRTLRLKGTDGATLQVYEWSGDYKQNGAVAGLHILHGMGEYSLRYKALAEYLTDLGFIVWVHDHRQHGYSIDHHEPGIYDSKDTWSAMISDVEVVQKAFRREWSPMPMMMLGHSMGSVMLRAYMQQTAQKFNAAVIMGTPVNSRWMLMAGRLIAQVQGHFHMFERSQLLNDLSFGSFNKGIKEPRTAMDWLSVNPDNVDTYMSDPLCGYVYNPKFYNELSGGMIEAGLARRMMDFPRIPVMFISGDEDPCGENGKGVEKVSNNYKRLGLNNRLVLLKGMRHEVLNETEKEETYHVLSEFLLEHV